MSFYNKTAIAVRSSLSRRPIVFSRQFLHQETHETGATMQFHARRHNEDGQFLSASLSGRPAAQQRLPVVR